MTRLTLARRSLTFFWRTNLAVVIGVGVAVSVLAGALLVGDSVRESLRRLALERLGRTEAVVAATTYVREQLAADLAAQPALRTAGALVVPLVALDGSVAHEASGSRAARVHVFGIDERFWRFHGIEGIDGPSAREALVSPALAAELGAVPGDAIVLRVQQPSEIPSSTVQGRRDQGGRAVRLTVRDVLPPDRLGEFSLVPQQGPVRSVFVPLARLQRDLAQAGRVNALLAAGVPAASLEAALTAAVTAADLGIELRRIDGQHALSLESDAGLVNDALRRAALAEADRLGYRALPVLTYMANSIRIGDRVVPYSSMSALDLDAYQRWAAGLEEETNTPAPRGAPASGSGQGEPRTVPRAGMPPMWLNAWAAGQLRAGPGDVAEVEFYLWSDDEGLTTSSTAFRVAGTVPMEAGGSDRTLTPEYPGITDATRMGEWDPPFPVDLSRIRPVDERYWEEHRAAPKAFIPLDAGERLWPSRFGTATSLRFFVPRETTLDAAADRLLGALRQRYSPTAAGLAVHPVRERALAASRGSTDFGEYFSYFSFFLVLSGLLLTGLFFRLGIEQRARQVGLLHAMGFTPGDVRRVLVLEGGLLAVAGSAIGMAGAVAFAGLILLGLRTVWVGAVGTTRLELAVSWVPLAAGVAAGIVMAVGAMWWTLRGLSALGARSLLAGAGPDSEGLARGARARRATIVAALLTVVALGLVGSVPGGVVAPAAGFFGGGACLLGAALSGFAAWLRRAKRRLVHGAGSAGLLRLGARQTTWRPGRSVLSAALIAAATFLIVAVGAFRRDAIPDLTTRDSSGGGYTLFAESLVPLMHDPGTRQGRGELGLDAGDEPLLARTAIARFRLRPGDEGSCLNLYRPTNPRIIAPTDVFRREGRFRFARAMAGTDAERENPWLLLDRRFDDGAVPVIGDANSLAYALHRAVGEDFIVPGPGGTPIVLRVVAALSDSVFQSELLVSERDFVRLFPRHEGYRFFLLSPPTGQDAAIAARVEDRLSDYGLDVQSIHERLAAYHRVENTYLSTFQALGALGLVLGTFGLGTVLLRNVLERQRELALLRAVGYRERHLAALVLAESALLLGVGVFGGTATAIVAIAPSLASRGASAPLAGTAWLLAAVLAAGVVSTWWAARTAARLPLLQALRGE